MAFYTLDSQPGAMTADLYEHPAVIGVEGANLEDVEVRINTKLGDCKAGGRVLAVSEIRFSSSEYGAWYTATIIWCKKRQIETGVPLDEEEEFNEPAIDDEPPPDYGEHPGAVIREYPF